jgi:hypothetical protein
MFEKIVLTQLVNMLWKPNTTYSVQHILLLIQTPIHIIAVYSVKECQTM